ncbi:MAG: outer membrane lipoprotein-sorting protein [Lautropia sp. SCN 69-89]|nr:MAG: outer membrane lipoprotein-sorting protein [Lautropia sp. SCN 69-89]
MKGWKKLSAAVALAVAWGSASGAASEQEAARLGKDLTPVGAEKAGNKEGTIPAWTGGITKAPAGWKPSDPRVDPYKDDKVLFSIDASNVDKYKDKLSEGQQTLIRTLKGYRMDVYPTRRSCGYSDEIYQRTAQNARVARLAEGGWQLENAVGRGVLFPVPKNGAEAVWNHKLRFQGAGRVEHYSTLFSAKSGDFSQLAQNQWVVYPIHDPAMKSFEDLKKSEAKILNEVVSPAARAGEMILVHWFMDRGSDAWLYFPGQRRVRRAPSFAYDNPVPGYENLETVDQYPMYAGAMDRYDWKLVGKKEMYIPYNNWKLIDKSRKFKDIYLPDYVNRDLMRYELHRVWVVEATLKEGMRHIFPRRVMYIDEDSWTLILTDLYDAQGKIWRVQEASLWVAPEIPACVSQEFVGYDLNVGRYIAETATQEHPPTDWLAGREGRINPNMFSPDELRRRGER